MNVDLKLLEARVTEIKESLWDRSESSDQKKVRNPQGAVQATLSILRLIYGDPSPQLTNFIQRARRGGGGRHDDNEHDYKWRLALDIEPFLDAALSDYRAGLTGNVRILAKGEVLGDFVSLAREALSVQSDAADKVAAVLTAGALEETLKQLAIAAGIEVYSRNMRGVIQKLKDGNALTGAQPNIAFGYAAFRDRAFHGQFDQVDRGLTESALAFVENLLTSKFS